MAQDQEKPSANTQTSVKVVDFGPFLDGSDRQGVADAVLESFKSIGFVYLANHGLPREKVASMFEWVRCFYSHTPSMI
jgi:isopenicillin N synthase-like dioxygenase